MNGLIQSEKQLKKLAALKEQQKKTDERFMKEALKLAKRAYDSGEVPVGAVIVKDGAVLSRGRNQKEQKNCAVYHAEINAIIKACKKEGWRLDDCTIYVTLEPCAMCAGAILSSRIKRVVFGASEEKSGFFGGKTDISSSSGLNHKVEIQSGVLEKECRELLQNFFKNKRV